MDEIQTDLPQPVHRFQCPICTKSFELRYQLKAHIRVHDRSGKAYKCPFSSYYCITEDHNPFHKKCNTRERKHKCPQCRMHFVKVDHLQRHLREAHSINNLMITSNIKEKFEQENENKVLKLEEACQSKVKNDSDFNQDDKEFLDEDENTGKLISCDEIAEELVETKNEPIDEDEDFWLNSKDALEIKNTLFEHDNPKIESHSKKKWEGTFHDYVQSNEEPTNCFKCPFCREIYAGKKTLNRHIRIHTAVRPIVCSLNNDLESIESSNNIFNDDDPIYEGLTEDYFFNMPESEVEKLFAKKTEEFEILIQDSEDTNNDPKKDTNHTCPHCFRIFKKKMYLRIHFRTHTGERPYKCTHCSQAFKQRPHLAAHKRIHTKERPYQCSYCPDSFKSKISLKRHITQHAGAERVPTPSESHKSHPGTAAPLNHTKEAEDQKTWIEHKSKKGLPLMKCPFCFKHFLSENCLEMHIESLHTGERRFKCPECQREFKKHSYLKQHMAVHRCVF